MKKRKGILYFKKDGQLLEAKGGFEYYEKISKAGLKGAKAGKRLRNLFLKKEI